uniref:Uncharacterized protein n=1 Tax=Anguilla anguilla TaxID=7936 RepID=A0A0E9WLE4_ANGAN
MQKVKTCKIIAYFLKSLKDEKPLQAQHTEHITARIPPSYFL